MQLFSDWPPSIGGSGSHANIRKKSNIANRSKSHVNFKQRIACDSLIANEVEMGLYPFLDFADSNRCVKLLLCLPVHPVQ